MTVLGCLVSLMRYKDIRIEAEEAAKEAAKATQVDAIAGETDDLS